MLSGWPQGSVPPGLEELDETCALDVADRGALTLDETGRVFRVTRERIRQIEAKAIKKLRRRGAALQDLLPGDE